MVLYLRGVGSQALKGVKMKMKTCPKSLLRPHRPLYCPTTPSQTRAGGLTNGTTSTKPTHVWFVALSTPDRTSLSLASLQVSLGFGRCPISPTFIPLASPRKKSPALQSTPAVSGSLLAQPSWASYSYGSGNRSPMFSSSRVTISI